MLRSLPAACLLSALLAWVGLSGCGGEADPDDGRLEPLQPGPPLVPPPKIHAPPEPLRAEAYGREVDAPADVWDVSIDLGGGVWLSSSEGVFHRPSDTRFFLGAATDHLVVGGLGPGKAAAAQGSGEARLLRLRSEGTLRASSLPAIHPKSARVRTFEVNETALSLVASGASVVSLDPDGKVLGTRALPAAAEAADLAVVEGPQAHELWVGTQLGVFRIRLDERGAFASNPSAPIDLVAGKDDDVVAMDACADGSVWISSLGNGVFRYRQDGRRLAQLTREDVLPQDHILSIACDPDGSVWFGSSWGGLSRRMADGSFHYHDMSVGLVGDSIRRLAIEANAAGERILWIATENGVASYAGP